MSTQRKTILLVVAASLLSPSCLSTNKNYTHLKEVNCSTDGYYIRSSEIPNMPSIRIKPERCDDYIFDIQRVHDAIDLFVKRYAEEFAESEKEVFNYLSGLLIEVSIIPKTVKNVYDVNGKLLSESYVSGLAYSKKHIWVEIKTKEIWSSSLMHELVHIVIWNKQGVHADPDHEGDKFSGWSERHTEFLNRIRGELLDAGI